MGERAFDKYEGLGNDFIVIDAAEEGAASAEWTRAACDRRRGVGADGVLLVLPPRERGHVARMRVINADGSVPEMCGNGLRCVALHVARARGAAAASGVYETDAGLRTADVELGDAGSADVTCEMGEIIVARPRAVVVDGARIDIVCADAGNPHAILFGRFARSDVERLGPRIATHPDFPHGTNVEFAIVEGGAVDVVVWERGVGITLACGTGACATVAAACERGDVAWDAPAAVRLPGGVLHVTVSCATRRALLRGPARRVFSGVLAEPPCR